MFIACWTRNFNLQKIGQITGSENAFISETDAGFNF